MKSRKILESRTGRDAPGVGRGLECPRFIALAQATANLRCPAAHQPSASTARCPAVTNAGRPRGQRRGTQRPGCTSAAAPGHCGTARKQRGNTARGGLRAARVGREGATPRSAALTQPDPRPLPPTQRNGGRGAPRAEPAALQTRAPERPSALRCALPSGPRGRAAAPSRPRTGPGHVAAPLGPAGAALGREAPLGAANPSGRGRPSAPPRPQPQPRTARPYPVPPRSPPPARRRKCKSAAAPQRPAPLKSFGGGAGPGAEGGGRERGGPGPVQPAQRGTAHLLLARVLRVDVGRPQARPLERSLLIAEEPEGGHDRSCSPRSGRALERAPSGREQHSALAPRLSPRRAGGWAARRRRGRARGGGGSAPRASRRARCPADPAVTPPRPRSPG